MTVKDGSEQKSEFVNFDLNGFALRGANNQGECYFVEKGNSAQAKDKSINSALVKKLDLMTKIVSKDGNPDLVNKNQEIKNGMIPTMETKLYFDDPLMTFEDSSVHGCTIDLTFDELKEFCEQKTWRSLAIF